MTYQIVKLRHNTKSMDNADGLLAYYQFNESEGAVLNKVGLNHGNLRGVSQRVVSSALIGDGFAFVSEETLTELDVPNQDISYDFLLQNDHKMFNVSNFDRAKTTYHSSFLLK